MESLQKKHKTPVATEGETCDLVPVATEGKTCDLVPVAAEGKTCDLVLFGDYMFPESNWKGEIPSEPIAVSTTDPKPGAPKETQVRVFAMGNVSGSKYWEAPGSKDHAEEVNDDAWLPQIVADELHERIVEEGRDSVAPGEFIEEACNESGESLLVVDAALLKKRCKAFYSMLVAKRMVAKFVLHKFFVNHVRPVSTMAVALKFIQQGTSLEEAQATTWVQYSCTSPTHGSLAHSIDITLLTIFIASTGLNSFLRNFAKTR